MNSLIQHLESLVSFLKPKSHTWLTSELNAVTLNDRAETMINALSYMIYKII